MIRDAERREVARRVRKFAETDAGRMNHGFWNRLADLIEPAPERTCYPVLEDGTLVCSECGEDIDGYGWNYCPNCGAKVVVE